MKIQVIFAVQQLYELHSCLVSSPYPLGNRGLGEKLADWRRRAWIQNDVVFFRYISADVEPICPEVYVWDLDKTYLDTNIGSLKDVLNTALEKAFQKRNVPGSATLVRSLRTSWDQKNAPKSFPLYFITATPPQFEGRIREKLTYDDIAPFGAFFKDNLRNLSPRRWWRLTKQVGYKLQALLQLRTRLREDVRQILWGDDSETDAVIYSLYSDVCSRRIDERELRAVLRGLHVGGEQLEVILDLQYKIPAQDPVEKIYINLAVDTDPEYYAKFGRRMVPTRNSFQIALDLFQDQRLSSEEVLVVANDLVQNYSFTVDELERSLDNMISRRILGAEAFSVIRPLLAEQGFVRIDFKPGLEPQAVDESSDGRVYRLKGVIDPWVPEHIDYLNDR